MKTSLYFIIFMDLHTLAAYRAFGPLLLASGMACNGLVKVSYLMQIVNKSKKWCI